MVYDENDAYSRANDPIYDKNLNSSIAVGGVLEMILNTQIPSGFSTGLFNGTETPQRTKFLNVNLVNNTATNNGDELVGANGNAFTLDCTVFLTNFKSWNKITFEGTGLSNIGLVLKDENNTTIRSITNGEDLTSYIIDKTRLKIVVSFTGACTITNIILGVNTKKYDNNNLINLPTQQIIGLEDWKTGVEEDLETVSIGTSNIQNGSVTNDKIASNAVTTAKISDSNVTTSKLADNAVTTPKITDNNITTSKINDKSVTTSKINDNAVTNTQLANNSVNSSNIIDGSIVNADINDNALIALSKIATDNLTLVGSGSWVDNPTHPMGDFTVKQYMFNNLNVMLTVVTFRGREPTQLDFKESYSNVLPIAPKTVLACWGENKRGTVDSGLVDTNCSWSVYKGSKNVTFIYYQGSLRILSWDFFMLSIQ
ncbi:hypothetical protein [Methanobrevibacter arboriphilus]|uniref:Uncharacterized protein n=1 Tax=Methanobrevibacter arboriphilus TaxID=39441 RepID=A0ACA8R444_METAZ|nr:hypothetical protein [Methanobrevibacter arboriphilus]BBL62441.1 hypothetical protein MarbSA_14810 [Methanobrevibacter arboriphilus]